MTAALCAESDHRTKLLRDAPVVPRTVLYMRRNKHTMPVSVGVIAGPLGQFKVLQCQALNAIMVALALEARFYLVEGK